MCKIGKKEHDEAKRKHGLKYALKHEHKSDARSGLKREPLRFMNRKETLPILDFLNENFGYSGDLDYVFVKNAEDKIYLCHRDIEKIDISFLKISSVGLYFGEILTTSFRLSMDGANLVGPECSKNILDLDDKDTDLWMKGYELDWDGITREFILIRHGRDFLGSGKRMPGKILNYTPKARRIRATI